MYVATLVMPIPNSHVRLKLRFHVSNTLREPRSEGPATRICFLDHVLPGDLFLSILSLYHLERLPGVSPVHGAVRYYPKVLSLVMLYNASKPWHKSSF